MDAGRGEGGRRGLQEGGDEGDLGEGEGGGAGANAEGVGLGRGGGGGAERGHLWDGMVVGGVGGEGRDFGKGWWVLLMSLGRHCGEIS